MLDTPGWRALCADLQELRAWEREARLNDVTWWLHDDGTHEFHCYSLYRYHCGGLPYVVADERCYDFGCMGNADRLMPGMIVELGANPYYDHWVSFPLNGPTMLLAGDRLGFVYSCVFDERDDAWHAVILCNMHGQPHDMTDPVWGVVRHRIARIEWYCQQFRGVLPWDRPYKAPGDITQGPLEGRLRSFLWYMQTLGEDTDSDVDSLAESEDAAEVHLGIFPSQQYLDALLASTALVQAEQ